MISTEHIIGFVIFFITYRFCIPLAVLFHEWGHALAALFMGAQHITVQWGQPSPQSPPIRLGRIQFKSAFLQRRGLRYGFCHYSSEGMSQKKIATIILAGPLSNLTFALASGSILFTQNMPYYYQFTLAACLVAHARLTLFNLIPLTVRDASGTLQANDGKQLCQLFKDKQEA